MLAVYPGMAGAHPVTQAQLVGAWFRRKRMEARMVANELARVFGAESQQELSEGDQDPATLADLGFSVKRIDVRPDDATTS